MLWRPTGQHHIQKGHTTFCLDVESIREDCPKRWNLTPMLLSELVTSGKMLSGIPGLYALNAQALGSLWWYKRTSPSSLSLGSQRSRGELSLWLKRPHTLLKRSKAIAEEGDPLQSAVPNELSALCVASLFGCSSDVQSEDINVCACAKFRTFMIMRSMKRQEMLPQVHFNAWQC